MLSDHVFTLVTHRFIPTLADDLKKFLEQNKCRNLFFIGHEFADLATRRSFIEENGKISRSVDFKFLPDTLVYFKDFLFTLYWLVTKANKTEIYIGYGAFNVLPALLFKHFSKIKKVIFYTVDFVPNRFGNKWLNNLYQGIDALAMRGADETWNLSPRMAIGREQFWGLATKDYPNQRVVPLGVWSKKLPEPKSSHEIFFSGHLLEKQGLQLVITALPAILKKVPDTTLRIVGDGEYGSELKRLVTKLNLDDHIFFDGKIGHQQQLELMSEAGVGVAMYKPEKDNYSYFADSAKIKTYLSAGLPVVMTDITYNAQDLQSAGCGIVVGYSETEFAKKIVTILGDAKKQQLMKQSAIKYIKNFNWETIFSQNLQRIIT